MQTGSSALDALQHSIESNDSIRRRVDARSIPLRLSKIPEAARSLYPELEEIGYDGVFSFEAKHDPFLTLAVASEHTEE